MARLSMLFMFTMSILFQETQSIDNVWSNLKIDCGASTVSETMIWTWRLDDEFIKTGQNNNVSTIIVTPEEIRTLRSFPNGQKNCYKLGLHSPSRYLIRAGFYYGNYDGLQKPPVFDLTINGQYWTTISTASSIDQVQYVEVMYPTKTTSLELCLVRFGDHVPFISSIEALQLFDDFYKLMNNDSILYLQSRIGFGSEGDVGEKSNYNRIWKLKNTPDYQNVSGQTISYDNSTSYSTENEPPYQLLANAITPKNNSNSNTSISMLIPVPLSPLSAYFVFYFKEPIRFPITYDRIRRIKIYIDGREMGITEVPQNYTVERSRVVSLYPINVNGPAANVTLVQAEGSTSPPILNGMEVFTSKELSTNGGRSINPITVILCFWLFFTSLAFLF